MTRRNCGGQNGTGTGFLRILRFPLPILIPPTDPQSPSSIIRGWHNRPVSGRRTKWTQSHPTQRNLKTQLSLKKSMVAHSTLLMPAALHVHFATATIIAVSDSFPIPSLISGEDHGWLVH
jgi:hypothetical protein